MRLIRNTLTAFGAIVFVTLISSAANAQVYNSYGGHDLFANQYTQGCANQANAAMYPVPVPVPPNVAQTYYTYQPLYPHEVMHLHTERYHNYYDNTRGLNRTKVRYSIPPVHTAASYIWRSIQLPRP